jgi:tetratricopeptide (TPR) repeat protein
VTSRRRGPYELGLLAAGLLAVIAYWPAMPGPFIFDDLDSIPGNPYLRSLWPPWRPVSALPDTSLSGRPVVTLSFALNYAAGGLDPRGYRAVNLALHIATALLLAGLVRRTVVAHEREALGARSAEHVGLAVAALWLIHPLQTECVSYIVQRTETLMGFFYVLTLYAAARGMKASAPSRWYALAVLFGALGMLCKESMATAPLAVLLWDRCYGRRSFVAALRERKGLYLGLAATWLILIPVVAGGHRSLTVGAGLGVSPLEYLRTQAGIILHYLRLVGWPSPLSIVYDDWPLATWRAAAGPLAVVGVLVIGAIVLLVRRPALGFPAFMFFLLLAPTSSVVPIVTEFAAERRMHLPLAALLGLIVPAGWWLVARAVGRSGIRPKHHLATALLAIVCLVLSVVTWQRNGDYAAAESIWRAALVARPASGTACINLGNVLLAEGRAEEALAEYQRAVQLWPDDYRAHYNLGRGLLAADEIAAALQAFAESLRLEPSRAELHNEQGVALARAGRLDEAEAAFRRALVLDPARAISWTNLGLALTKQKRWADAEAAYRRALELDPWHVTTRQNFASLLLDRQRYAEAEALCRETVRKFPKAAAARLNLAIALAMQGRQEEAAGELRELLQRSPDHAAARRMLAELEGGGN